MKDNIIKLSNGRIYTLLEDNLTTQDYRELSGVEVREIRYMESILRCERWAKKTEEIYEKTGLLVCFF